MSAYGLTNTTYKPSIRTALAAQYPDPRSSRNEMIVMLVLEAIFLAAVLWFG